MDSPRENTLNAKARELAELLQQAISDVDGAGFTLFLFDMSKDGPPGYIAYISNADRESMIKSIKEWLAVQAARAKTPGKA